MNARTLLLTPWLLAALAAPALAQVAAPSLLPVNPFVDAASYYTALDFVTLNPAAMQWGAPSRIGAAALEVTRDEGTGSDLNFAGEAYGARGVWERFSLAAEASSVKDDEASFDYTQDTTFYGLAAQPFGWLALGASQYEAKIDDGGNATTDTIGAYGVSLRLSEMFFVGYTSGRETLDSYQLTEKVSRDVRAFGVGFRRGGSFNVHAEYYSFYRAPYKINGGYRAKDQADVGVLELGLGSLVAGYRAFRYENKSDSEKSDGQQVSLAWAPASGFTLGAHLATSTDKNADGSKKADEEVRTISVGWQF